MQRKSPAPRFPDAEYVGHHLVIDRTEWVPGEHPEPHLREEGQTTYPESYFRCIRCGAERLRKRAFPEECDAGRDVRTESATSTRPFRAGSERTNVIAEAPDRYTVVGESGREYVVDLRGDPTCTCPDFSSRSGVEECTHVRRAQLETGQLDVDRIREGLAIAAVNAEEQARKRERESAELRTRARRIRRAVDRLDEPAGGD